MGFLGKTSRYRGGNYCCAFSCKNSTWTEGLRYFRVPKDYQRGKLWLERAGRTDLLTLDPVRWSKSYRLCSKHFLPSQVSCSGRLVWNATPSIFPQNTRTVGGPLTSKSEETNDPGQSCADVVSNFEEINHTAGDPRSDGIEHTMKSEDCQVYEQQSDCVNAEKHGLKASGGVVERVVYCKVDDGELLLEWKNMKTPMDKDPLDLSEGDNPIEAQVGDDFHDMYSSEVSEFLIPVKSECEEY